ncbi:MAG: oxidoreductase [Salinisphaeraceae bacterium]|nr:oxidoreductase [Salinisphaeraceae bacterium]
MSKWTVKQIPPQNGRLVIITGANSGIGFETAVALAGSGAHVIMACRNTQKAETAADAIRKRHGQAKLSVMKLDISDLDSVRDFAEQVRNQHKQLHLLINNAGVMGGPEISRTRHGFESQFGTNHLGHFALTGLLLPLLTNTPGSRIVVVSSIAHTKAKNGLNLDDPNFENSEYSLFDAYAKSKLANLTFMFELNRRLLSSQYDVRAVGAHPGYTASNITSGANPEDSKIKSFLAWLGNVTIAMPTAKGALPTLYAATDSSINGGEHIGPKGPLQFWGWPSDMPCSQAARDPAAGSRLWQISQDLTGVQYLS